jgi:hypothetical protein
VVAPVSAAGVAGAVQPVPGTLNLFAVACPSATTCVAVGDNGVGGVPADGVVVPITNGTPDTAQAVLGTDVFLGAACSSTASCVAVGFTTSGQGVVMPITNGVPGIPQPVGGTYELVPAITVFSPHLITRIPQAGSA